jgi:hypothetical protein
MVFPTYSQEAAEHLRQLGKSVEYNEIPGDGGHIDAIYNIRRCRRSTERFSQSLTRDVQRGLG